MQRMLSLDSLYSRGGRSEGSRLNSSRMCKRCAGLDSLMLQFHALLLLLLITEEALVRMDFCLRRSSCKHPGAIERCHAIEDPFRGSTISAFVLNLKDTVILDKSQLKPNGTSNEALASLRISYFLCAAVIAVGSVFKVGCADLVHFRCFAFTGKGVLERALEFQQVEL